MNNKAMLDVEGLREEIEDTLRHHAIGADSKWDAVDEIFNKFEQFCKDNNIYQVEGYIDGEWTKVTKLEEVKLSE